MNPSFDLIEQPWIPCIGLEGRRVELGLEEVLLRSHELGEVRDESPLATAALLRLLLAVLHASLEGPKDIRAWKALWSAGRWDERKVKRYLKEWRGRFDLFDEKHPFFQIGGFEIIGKGGSPVTKLTHELSTGNSATLFDHTVEERLSSVAPAVAARWLVTCQSYALGGGVGATSNKYGKHPNFTHAPMVGGVAAFVQGRSLFETLALNLVTLGEDGAGPMPSRGTDRPTWEQDRIDGPQERRPRGYLEFLTWRSRALRLLPEVQDGRLAVSRMHFASGWQMDRSVLNPFFAYIADAKRGPLSVAFRQGRALWRDSSALLTTVHETDGGKNRRPAALNLVSELAERDVLPMDAPLRCITLGLANDKAKVLFWRRESWAVPTRLIEDESTACQLVAALKAADEGGKATYAALSRFAEHFKDGVPELRERAWAAYWADLEPAFRRLLSDLAGPGQNALMAWTSAVVGSARRALQEHTDNAQRRSARELRARVDAQGLLAWKLKQLTVDGEERADGNS